MRRFIWLIVAAIACSAVNAQGQGQGQGYPNRPIRLVMPFPPGGNVDTFGRVLARQLEAQLSQPLVVDNRGGANGILGVDIVAKAVPDGYTLLDTSFSFVVNPSIYRKLPYDTEKDFVPITNFALGLGYVLTAHPSLTALLGGEVHLTFTAAAVGMPHIKSGKLKALGFSGAARLASLPDVPTIAESGLPDFLYDSGWHGIFAPAKTPPAIVNRIYDEVRKAVQEPKIRDLLITGGYEPKADPPAEFAKLFRADIRKYAEIVKAAKIEPQ